MASRTSTPQSRSRSSTGSSSSSDTTMIDVPPQSPSRPVRLRNPSQSNPSSNEPPSQAASCDPTFSRFLSLPRELRDRIYTFALTSPYYFGWPGKGLSNHEVSVNLLRTNRQVYEEAVPILYSLNKFLFMHPSDCNIFRVVASPYSSQIQSVYFRIREKDLRLWTSYLGSKNTERSLRADLPKLKSLWIFMRCGSMGTPAMLAQLGAAQALQGLQGIQGLPPGAQMHVQAVQNVLGQQVQVLQQQVQSLTQLLGDANAGGPSNATPHAPQTVSTNANGHVTGTGGGHQVPPPPPPPPPPFMQFAQGGLGLGHVHGHGGHHHHQPPPPPLPHQHGTQNNPPNPSPLAQHLAHTQQNNLPLPPPLHHLPFAPVIGQAPQALVPGQNAPHFHQHAHQHTLYSSFLRFEREMGIESLCLSLHETLSPSTSASSISEVKIVCIMRLPRREVERLVQVYPDELTVDDRNGEAFAARTRFRKLHGVEVSLELGGYSNSEGGRGRLGD